MSVVSRALDPIAAELLERLAQIDDVTAACSVVLGRVAAEGVLERAVALVWMDQRVESVGYGIADEHVAAITTVVAERSARLAALVEGRDPVLLDEAPSPLDAFDGCVAIPFRSAAGESLGCILMEAPALNARTTFVAELLRRCGPSIGRVLQLDAESHRLERVGRQRDLLTSIIDALPDPVLLTSPDNAILLANRRAERLFSLSSEDSEGRRRAIQVNTLFFSSFLTRAVIGTAPDPVGRELNLVDPTDGSDLFFEVLSEPLPASVTAEGSVLSILRDITDLKRAVTELEDQNKRSRLAEFQARRERDQRDAILENVSDPILVTDEQSNIILMNPEAERLFVVPPGLRQVAMGRRAVEANDTKFTTLISDFLLRSGNRRVVKLEVMDPDTDRSFPVEVVSSKILDARGEPRAIVSILHDLTQAAENERLARELQELNADLENRVRRATVELEEHNHRLEWQSYELERAYRLKSEFLASMSHELRTPINVILGYTSLSRERIYGELTEQQEEALDKIYGTSQHLLELINDILDLSKIEAGKMPLHLEVIRIDDLVRELSETVQPMLYKKGLAYEAQFQPELPSLRTDRTKLKQILLNLLSNAIKFTHTGTIRVEVGLPAPDLVRIAVADTGIGIPADDLDVIFDDFRQIDQSRTREYGGTGLGLSITKRLLTLLGGHISVESEYGTGSCFTIELPVHVEAGTIDEQVRRAVVESDSSIIKP